jgi:hypothetical protein
MKTPASLIALLLFSGTSAFADVASPPSLTMELCGDMDIDAVQRALELEYWSVGDNGKTKVNLSCRGSAATLRIVGPEHPLGRVTEMNLQDVDPVARPRTIAMLASELWTAPEPEPQATLSQRSPIRRDVVLVQEEPAEPIDYHRDRYSFGISRSSMSRETTAIAADSQRLFYADMTGFSLRVEAPVKPYLKLFAEYGTSGDYEFNYLPDRLSWSSAMLGATVPLARGLWTPRLRVDLVGSIGYDTMSLIDGGFQTILPDFGFTTVGLSASLAVGERGKIFSSSSIYRGRTHDLDTYIQGGDFVLGASFEMRQHFLLSASVHARELEGGFQYSDSHGSTNLAISYLH